VSTNDCTARPQRKRSTPLRACLMPEGGGLRLGGLGVAGRKGTGHVHEDGVLRVPATDADVGFLTTMCSLCSPRRTTMVSAPLVANRWLGTVGSIKGHKPENFRNRKNSSRPKKHNSLGTGRGRNFCFGGRRVKKWSLGV